MVKRRLGPSGSILIESIQNGVHDKIDLLRAIYNVNDNSSHTFIASAKSNLVRLIARLNSECGYDLITRKKRVYFRGHEQ